jgi:hypothetical protein
VKEAKLAAEMDDEDELADDQVFFQENTSLNLEFSTEADEKKASEMAVLFGAGVHQNKLRTDEFRRRMRDASSPTRVRRSHAPPEEPLQLIAHHTVKYLAHF